MFEAQKHQYISHVSYFVNTIRNTNHIQNAYDYSMLTLQTYAGNLIN
jgi:hypothetical protein